MRTLLLASLTIATLQNPADACGPYVVEPTVFQLARGYALLNEEPTETPVWRRLAPDSYDSTQIADATPLATPRTITLVGPSGTKVVTGTQRAFFKSGFTRTSKATVALAIPNGGSYSVALAGAHANAKWIALDTEVRGSKAELDWVSARGVTPYRGYGAPMVYLHKLKNTTYDTVTVFAKEGGMVTFVRSGGHEVARFDGDIVGGVTVRGQAFAISSDRRGVLTSFAL
jgi:hypothetical protein